MTVVHVLGPFNSLNNRGGSAASAAKLIGPTNVVRNLWTRGDGRIAGNVLENALPADLPLRRRVRLFDLKSARLYAEVWSDAATGAYAFENIDAARVYFVVADDHTANYNAVIKDRIAPEPMP